MKHCWKCSLSKPEIDFGVNKSKPDGLATECKPCKRQQDREYAAQNREVAKQRASEWYYANKEYALNRNKLGSERWRKANPDKHCARQNLRRANKLKATPMWLTELHKVQIACKYSVAAMLSKNTEEQYHVDHIVPLKGKTVCGLHVPWNLQVIPAQENLRKSNKI
jgi:hypothetical protein